MAERTGSASAGRPDAERIEQVCAHAGDDGFKFIFPASGPGQGPGGLLRQRNRGHFLTLVGRGGTGKSFLALQLVTQLLRDGEAGDAAFYFTLEASPVELSDQAGQFAWGRERYLSAAAETETEWSSNGLHITSIPSPVASLGTLIRKIRQTIADRLHEIRHIAAVVIDPIGGVSLERQVREELDKLKELAESHRTFLILLAEDHLFEQFHSIEHYSQTIIRLRHHPEKQPYRSLYVQKARNQNFRSGYHQLEFHHDLGLRIFPSIQAQASYAHDPKASEDSEEGKATDREEPDAPPFMSFPLERGRKPPEGEFPETIIRASVVFLMGPPGTFKQRMATRFATVPGEDPTIYISFKADSDAVTRHSPPGTKVVELDATKDPKEGQIHFMEARSPLLTPEKVLSDVRQCIERRPYRRAIVWGLRRLNDMPNFAEGKEVQFLEALVTLLKGKNITCLLVDWPDKERASTLPIVDLSQYIFLTRVCRSRYDLENPKPDREGANIKLADGDLDLLWGGEAHGQREHVTLLRIQRSRHGFHRSKGVLFYKDSDEGQGSSPNSPAAGGTEASRAQNVRMLPIESEFEKFWQGAGIRWEEDPGLVH